MNAKERILKAGARIVHQKGFYNTGLAEVLEAAGVPKGSFYFHFKNKEEFGLQLIDYFSEYLKTSREGFYEDQGLSHIEKIRGIFKSQSEAFKQNDFKGGCPIGNLALETGDCNDNFRNKLNHAFIDIKKELTLQLEMAKKSGEISESLNSEEVADFIQSSWEGALMQMKVSRSTVPHKIFDQMIFEKLLKS